MALAAGHSFVEPALRPARAALAGDMGIGDSLPRSHPTFAAWSNLSMSAVIFVAAVGGVMLAAVFERAGEVPLLWVVIGGGLTLCFTAPVFIGVGSSPSMQPIRDLAAGTERVAAGDYSIRLPVVQDDDLGVLSASFNRMQAGLAERQRLHAAFGTYVDPALAARLLEQGDDVFTGERREVTMMFIDIRDFTPFAEANTAEDTVARLNALFEIVVPAVVEVGGHVNKFLGDGMLAVFGALEPLPDHAGCREQSGHARSRRDGAHHSAGLGHGHRRRGNPRGHGSGQPDRHARLLDFDGWAGRYVRGARRQVAQVLHRAVDSTKRWQRAPLSSPAPARLGRSPGQIGGTQTLRARAAQFRDQRLQPIGPEVQ